VDVVDDFALLIEFALQSWCAWRGVLELIAEIGVGFFEAFPIAAAVTEGFTDDEAEGGGQTTSI